MRASSEPAIAFLKHQEGLRLKAYRDFGGAWTIGYGHAGPDVTPGMTIGEPMADKLLRADTDVAATRLAARVDPAVLASLTEAQYAALLSFTFNVGADPAWRIWTVLGSGDLDGVPDQLRRFRFARDPSSGRQRPLAALVRRRDEECALWTSGIGAPALTRVSLERPEPLASLAAIRRRRTCPTPTSARLRQQPPHGLRRPSRPGPARRSNRGRRRRACARRRWPERPPWPPAAPGRSAAWC
ncbi:MAG: lysozyme [Caulobacteraceae bacterium]